MQSQIDNSNRRIHLAKCHQRQLCQTVQSYCCTLHRAVSKRRFPTYALVFLASSSCQRCYLFQLANRDPQMAPLIKSQLSNQSVSICRCKMETHPLSFSRPNSSLSLQDSRPIKHPKSKKSDYSRLSPCFRADAAHNSNSD